MVSFRTAVERVYRCAASSVMPCVTAAVFLSAVGTRDDVQAATSLKSIREWVSCTGTADDTAGTIKAFAAARNNAFTLVVDCPVRLHSGLAIDKAVFIDQKTTVEFTAAGKFIVDNLFHPAFVIANTRYIALVNWNVEWQGSVPVDPNVDGFVLDGKFVPLEGRLQPAGVFNDTILTHWLQTNRAITFDEALGYVKPVWVGAVNMSAVFYITGDSSYVVVRGMNLHVPANASGHGFMPMAFSLSQNWKSHQRITSKTPRNATYLAVPNHMTFSGITLDGTLMGWQGNAQDVMFENIASHRYGDLQDATGGHVGGIGKWFPPPHLFYLNHTLADDPKLYNMNIRLDGINDMGPRVGVARDKGGSDSISGYALSLKLGCAYCSVNNYRSARPDGFMDLLPSEEVTVSNVFATFDSEFINNVFPAGLRFPGVGYSHVTFENIQFEDTAPYTLRAPIGIAGSTSNVAIVFTNFNVDMKRWAGPNLPLTIIRGNSNDVSLDLIMSTQSTQVSYLLKGTVSSTLKATPVTIRPGATTVLSWSSTGAESCSAAGAWTGSVGTSGSRVVKVGSSNSYDFALDCKNAAHSSGTKLQVTTQ